MCVCVYMKEGVERRRGWRGREEGRMERRRGGEVERWRGGEDGEDGEEGRMER